MIILIFTVFFGGGGEIVLRSYCLQPNFLHGGNVSGGNLTVYTHMEFIKKFKQAIFFEVKTLPKRA